ncbi:nitroreductase family deazaflavin-dependent oxidoreductase [Thermostaphylospora chromogena]|uniref:Deazaflavin-dependent oxidoreductase, nitroreductase family n=1 Tax=Thermostaphylospora chromogena TaxID=35622 RepID=A0A1H1BTV7_9ACTN|nr:nitroreductase family deazaflavin-dependent oxidoreductase [Thermostaphylospora chromogena]SDQ55402.1 deazaflavin-dependent oxidoreductase, nitroreductase family [Thermostaphylospora chromogena]
MKIIGTPSPPRGLRRLLWRLPIRLYRLGLGRLFGHRLMLLTHVGRVSGRPRQAVVEVVERGADHYIVASGFGTRSDWYRNVRAHPEVTIETGGRRMAATAVVLSAAEGGGIMARYAARHPRTARRLCRIMGFAVDGSAADYRAVGERIPFVRFDVRP